MVSISFQKFTLPNGLEVIVHEDHSLPVAAVNVWYHVGSKDEEAGRTGFAHLFEHVMFEGSQHHNRSYFDPLQKVGANLNGSTTPDRTNYWETVPSNYLELALWLESDRMGFLLEALDQKRFDVQRDVVKNERRQSYENRPYGMAHMLLQPAVFPAPHPYSWTTIGDPEDLDAATVDDIKAFFRRFYTPSNASLAIAGDVDTDGVRRLVERYFGDLPPGEPINRVGRMDSDLRGQVSLTMRDKVQLPRLYLVWPTGPLFDSEQAPLDVVSVVLGDGKSSRLYRSLVYDKQIARDVGIYHHAQAIAGELHVQATASPGHGVDELEEVILEELDRIGREPIAESELERAKTRIEVYHTRQLERLGGFGGRADQLNYYNVFAGDPGVINTDVARYRAVRPDQIMRVSQAAAKGSRVKLSVLPEVSLTSTSSTVDRTVMPGAGPEPSFAPPVPTRTRLANGLGIVVVEKPGLPMVAFGLLIGSGGANDPPDRPGLTQMTGSMLQEGTNTRTSQQIAEEMEALGAHLESDASREYVLLLADTMTSHWETALTVVADVVRNPTFPDEELERLRRERLTDLRRIADSPVAIASRASRALLYGQGTRYGHPLGGNEESVQSFTRDMLAGHWQSHFGPDNATLLVVGDVSRADAVSLAEAHFGDWQSVGVRESLQGAGSDAAPGDPTQIFLADKPGAVQSVIRAGHLTIPRSDPEYFNLNLLNYIFGGQYAARLNMNLRQDKGYSYGYTSSIDWFNGPSALVAGGAVQTEVTKESVVETLREFADIRGPRPVTEEEFSDAKEGLLRSLPAQFEARAQLLHQLVRLVTFDLPDDYFSHLADNIGAVSLSDVRRAAEERLLDGHLKVLVVGDSAAIEPGLRELGLPLARVDYEGRKIE